MTTYSRIRIHELQFVCLAGADVSVNRDTLIRETPLPDKVNWGIGVALEI